MPRLYISKSCRSLNASVAAAVTGLRMDIQHSDRTTLLFVSHDLNLREDFCKRGSVHRGLPLHGRSACVTSEPQHPERSR
ncbi:MAG: hypothetical protein AAFY02_20630 [Pseudomonadota bacterium]